MKFGKINSQKIIKLGFTRVAWKVRDPACDKLTKEQITKKFFSRWTPRKFFKAVSTVSRRIQLSFYVDLLLLMRLRSTTTNHQKKKNGSHVGRMLIATTIDGKAPLLWDVKETLLINDPSTVKWWMKSALESILIRRMAKIAEFTY